MGKIRMLFRLRYWGDLLWITLCIKIHLLHLRDSLQSNGPREMCPCPVSIRDAAQRTLTARLCTAFSFFYMYITAAIPYFRDIINSGHNVSVKKRVKSFTVTKVSEAREKIHIFSNSIGNAC